MIKHYKCKITHQRHKGLQFNGSNKEDIDKFLGEKGKVVDNIETNTKLYKVMINKSNPRIIKIPQDDYIMYNDRTGFIIFENNRFHRCFKRIS